MTSFRDAVSAVDPAFATFDSLKTLQVNLGDLCNLACSHCHVDASRAGTRIMSREVMAQLAAVLARRTGLMLDITGGCPEMSPDFRFLVESTNGLCQRRLLRSNLVVMTDPGMEWLPQFCRDQKLTIVASLPCYLEENVDRQRGQGVYRRSIEALKILNALGYGAELELNLVYNPGGAFISPGQHDLEDAYRSELMKRHGIVFNNLYTITNAPIGRFRQDLETSGKYGKYVGLLVERFNPSACAGIMCRTLVSVDWRGVLYNCDFNQALDLPIRKPDGIPMVLADLDAAVAPGAPLVLDDHCFCCTAGEGSSCTGALAA